MYRHNEAKRARWVLLGALYLSHAIFISAQDDSSDVPEANPARPTVSTPATISPAGYLQFENGGLYGLTSTEFTKRFGIEQVTKISVDSRAEFLFLSEPYTFSEGAAVPGQRPGEVFAGMQTVIVPAKGLRPTIAGQYLRRLYASPAPEMDLGTFVQSAGIFFSGDPLGFHFDLNGLVMEQQDDTTKIRKPQFAQTLSVSHPVGKVVVSGEMWHFAQPLIHGSAVGNLWCVSYAVRRNLVLDAGFDHGLTGTSTDWEGIAGFTYLLPHRLWRRRNAVY
jgi:hypothetical protein